MVIASDFAKSVHAGQRYGNEPYDVHLYEVAATAADHYDKYSGILRLPLSTIINACWLHDCMEDRGVKYQELLAMFGHDVAEIVYACTLPKGRSRRDRFTAEYYQGIRETPGAAFVKICDRLCNIRHSPSNSLRAMYQKEWDNFIKNVDPEGIYRDLYNRIN